MMPTVLPCYLLLLALHTIVTELVANDYFSCE